VIPSKLITEASRELPYYSPLFKDAAKSADLLDETGLDTWDSGLPYPTGPPSDNPRELAFTKCLEEVMHRWCMHMLREQQQRWSNIPTKTLCKKMNRGIMEWESGEVVVLLNIMVVIVNAQWHESGFNGFLVKCMVFILKYLLDWVQNEI
jgi:hypothetical protein